MHRSSRLLFALTIALLCGPGHAQANWSMIYNGPTDYVAAFDRVPDFDQRWTTLPGQGSMYCVPTAHLNWMAYIARHGYPLVEPGSQNVEYWHSPDAHGAIQGSLFLMGLYMGTDPVEGTGSGSLPGIQNWLAQTGSHFFFNIQKVYLDSDTPRFEDVAHWVQSGVPVVGVVGWYEGEGMTLVRDGGHAFTVIAVERDGAQRRLVFHDPAHGDDDRTEQSPALWRRRVLEERVRFVKGVPRVIDAVLDYEPGYLDGYTVIKPIAGLAVSLDGIKLQRFQPLGLEDDPNPRVEEIPSPGGALITDVAFGGRTPHTFFTTGSTRVSPDPKLWSYDPVTGEHRELADLDDPRALELDRFGKLLVLDGGFIRRFGREEGRWSEIASRELPTVCTDLAMDDVNDRIALLCDQRLLLFTIDDLFELGGVDIPAGIPLEEGTSLAVSPVDGAYFLSSPGASGVYRFVNSSGFGTIGSGLVGRARGISIGDGDCLYVVDGATDLVRVFCPDENVADYVERTDLPFSSFAAGAGLKIGRSRTNFDPALHTGPEYRDVLPRGEATSVDGDLPPGAIPSSLAIASITPNPFNPRTTVFMDVPRTTDLTLTVHDVRGRLVRTLYSGVREAGRHAVTWEGTDASGRAVASGVYVVRLTTADGEQRTQKITLTE